MVSRVFTLIVLFMAALHVSAFAVDMDAGQEKVMTGFIKKSGSPYQITETVVVPKGKAMVVEAGSVFEFYEGAGLDVRGVLAVIGEARDPVVFKAKNSVWNGVSITGEKKSEVQGLRVENAQFGFAVESGSLDLSDVTIENSSRAAIYVRNGFLDAQWLSISNCSNVAVWTAQGAVVNVTSSTLEHNRLAIFADDGSDFNIQASRINDNEVGVLDVGSISLKPRNLVIEQNQVAIVSEEVPSSAMMRSLGDNTHKIIRDVSKLRASLGEEPLNPYADETKLFAVNDMVDSSWKVTGNIVLEMGYHGVLMGHNYTNQEIFGADTIRHGERFKNYFQVPGLFASWIANVAMESPTGQTIDLSMDVSSDEWNVFNVHFLQAVYTDAYQRIALGDIYSNGGKLYLDGVNSFGASYDLSLFKNAAKEPLFEMSLFGGEVQAPKLVGERDPIIYQDRIEDGEAEAQEMILGGKIRWNMHRRFNGTLGFIGRKDYMEDPFLRDGMSLNRNTSSPLISSRTFFADGNWLVYPGDIKLNGQVAVGVADTANAAAIRAMNQVFAEAGLDASNFGLLNKLMKNPTEINRLTQAQLESIFGDNSMMTVSGMKNKLRALLAKAQSVAKEQKITSNHPSHVDYWNHRNWAVAGSYEWSNDKTFIEGFLRYVGRGFYSAGSPDQLQNTRLYGGNLKQKITDFWKLNFGYSVNIENAADHGDGYNIFGLGEGNTWGLTGADDEWLKKHEQDEDRTLYIHDAYLGNSFDIVNNWALSLKYSVNYRTRSTSQRLYSNYSVNSGIYDDEWFKPRKGMAIMDVVEDGDTLKIDSARWAKYYNLSDEDYLASQFEENLLKHTFELGVTYKFPKNVLKVGGTWIYRTDLSEFVNDKLIKDLGFSDETFGILGYYFHGGDYFEQSYPVSLTTTLEDFRNTFTVKPRYKTYNRDEMSEFEWSLSDEMSFPVMEDFMDLTLNGLFRQSFLDRTVGGKSMDEMELDVEGSASIRLHHTQSLHTDWTMGALCNYRPDNRQDQYKDIYFIVTLEYTF